MASIHRHRNKYQVRVRRKGLPTITKTFHKLSDAKEWATLQEHQADRGELGPDRKELERITLASLVTRYRNEVVPTKKGAEIETIILDAFLRHSICKRSMADLSTADFANYRDERLKTITAKSLKRQLSPISNMFEVARKEWKIPLRGNPLSEFSLKVIDNKRTRRLQTGELERLMEAGKKTRNKLVVPIIRLAIASGMRRSEILALRFRDVDPDRRSATIREAKNGFSRTIPLSAAARAVLSDAIGRMNKAEREKNGKLFPVTPLALRLAWDKLTRRAKIVDLHFHDLRHEAISRLFELGLTVPEVASVSGHRTLGQLMRYSHATDTSIRSKLLAAE